MRWTPSGTGAVVTSDGLRAELPGGPASVGTARRLVSGALKDWGLPHLTDVAALLVSEAATNAVLHARTELLIEVERRDDVVRISVVDASPLPPQRRRHGLHAGTGRGLGLLETLATRWGTEPADEPWAKVVWFELPVDPADLRDPGEDALQAF